MIHSNGLRNYSDIQNLNNFQVPFAVCFPPSLDVGVGFSTWMSQLSVQPYYFKRPRTSAMDHLLRYLNRLPTAPCPSISLPVNKRMELDNILQVTTNLLFDFFKSQVIVENRRKVQRLENQMCIN